MNEPQSAPIFSDRQNIYEQAAVQLSSDELRRFTRALAAAVEIPTAPDQIVAMHGLAHHAAMLGDHNLAESFKAMAHATAIDYTTELEVADLAGALAAGIPQTTEGPQEAPEGPQGARDPETGPELPPAA